MRLSITFFLVFSSIAWPEHLIFYLYLSFLPCICFFLYALNFQFNHIYLYLYIYIYIFTFLILIQIFSKVDVRCGSSNTNLNKSSLCKKREKLESAVKLKRLQYWWIWQYVLFQGQIFFPNLEIKQHIMTLDQLISKLTQEFTNENYETCFQLLTPLKIQLIEHNLLVPSIQTSINPNDLKITRQVLEIGALVSINLLKMQEFSNCITLLKPFYESSTLNDEASQKNKLLSLYLLLLLTQDDLALFHIELEKFQNYNMNVDDLENDEFLSIPIKFEKWIIDGDFNKIHETLVSKHKFPCKEFNIFEDELLNSMRLNIANNLETVYRQLPIENLRILLFLKEISQVHEFVENFNWKLVNGVVYFEKQNKTVLDETNQIDEINDEKSIIRNSLIYATEMERII